MKIKLLTLLLFTSLIFTGCKTDLDVFNDTATGFAQSDKHINQEEFNKLKTEVDLFADDRAFKKFYAAGVLDEIKLIEHLKSLGFEVRLAPVTNHKNDIVNVYIENSGSIFGYANGDTEYKTALTELLVHTGSIYGKKNISLHFINTRIYPVTFKGNVAQYPRTLTPEKLKVGDIYSSDINEILRLIIEKTPKNTISILISDCIYSISGDEDTTGKLEIQRSLTKDVFQGNDITTIIAKFNSLFNGYYYPKNNIKQKTVQPRPYYISVLGAPGSTGFFYNNINIRKLKGYQNQVVLSSAYNKQSVYHTVLSTNNSSGFRPIRKFSDGGSVGGMEDIQAGDRDGKVFTFSVAVDMSSIPVEEDVATNPNSYTITAGNYKIKKITPYTEIGLKSASVNLIKKSGKTPTHIIHFEATTKQYTDLEFSLKNEIPKWIYDSSTNDDTDVNNLGSKTFGFKYLIEGISQAYQKEAKPVSYFKINIKINQ
ncbi:MAG: hypothetical protein V4581_16105 [Bacteroidota bacterium]